MSCTYDILKIFVFSDSGPEPYSPNLNDAVFISLQRFDSGDLRKFIVDSSMREYYRDEICATEEQFKELREISEAVLRNVGHCLVSW